MLSKENIQDALTSARGTFPDTYEKDIAFLVLCDGLADKSLAHRCIYEHNHKPDEVADFLASPKMRNLADVLKPFGVGSKDNLTVTSEENMNAMAKMLKQIDSLQENSSVPDPDLIKLAADIRFKMQAKFDLQQDANEQKHIIIVPQKHDLICKYTQRECSAMPSKEACMEYWNLKESEE